MTRKEFKELINSNKTANEIKAICEKYWYVANKEICIDIYWEPRIWISQLDRTSRFPDVWLDTWKIWEHNKPEFWTWKINASSSWTLNIREFTLFMYQLNQAKRMVEELNELDLTTLPRVPVEWFEDDNE